MTFLAYIHSLPRVLQEFPVLVFSVWMLNGLLFVVSAFIWRRSEESKGRVGAAMLLALIGAIHAFFIPNDLH